MCVSVSEGSRKMFFECRDGGDYGATGAVAVGTVQVFKLQSTKCRNDSIFVTHVNTQPSSDDDSNDSLQASVYCTTIFDFTDIFMLELIPSFSIRLLNVKLYCDRAFDGFHFGCFWVGVRLANALYISCLLILFEAPLS